MKLVSKNMTMIYVDGVNNDQWAAYKRKDEDIRFIYYPRKGESQYGDFINASDVPPAIELWLRMELA